MLLESTTDLAVPINGHAAQSDQSVVPCLSEHLSGPYASAESICIEL